MNNFWQQLILGCKEINQENTQRPIQNYPLLEQKEQADTHQQLHPHIDDTQLNKNNGTDATMVSSFQNKQKKKEVDVIVLQSDDDDFDLPRFDQQMNQIIDKMVQEVPEEKPMNEKNKNQIGIQNILALLKKSKPKNDNENNPSIKPEQKRKQMINDIIKEIEEQKAKKLQNYINSLTKDVIKSNKKRSNNSKKPKKLNLQQYRVKASMNTPKINSTALYNLNQQDKQKNNQKNDLRQLQTKNWDINQKIYKLQKQINQQDQFIIKKNKTIEQQLKNMENKVRIVQNNQKQTFNAKKITQQKQKKIQKKLKSLFQHKKNQNIVIDLDDSPAETAIQESEISEKPQIQLQPNIQTNKESVKLIQSHLLNLPLKAQKIIASQIQQTDLSQITMKKLQKQDFFIKIKLQKKDFIILGSQTRKIDCPLQVINEKLTQQEQFPEKQQKNKNKMSSIQIINASQIQKNNSKTSKAQRIDNNNKINTPINTKLIPVVYPSNLQIFLQRRLCKDGKLIDLGVITLFELIEQAHSHFLISNQLYFQFVKTYEQTDITRFINCFIQDHLDQWNFALNKITIIDHRRWSHLLYKLYPSKYLMKSPMSLDAYTNQFLQNMYRLSQRQYNDMMDQIDDKQKRNWWKPIKIKYLQFFPNAFKKYTQSSITKKEPICPSRTESDQVSPIKKKINNKLCEIDRKQQNQKKSPNKLTIGQRLIRQQKHYEIIKSNSSKKTGKVCNDLLQHQKKSPSKSKTRQSNQNIKPLWSSSVEQKLIKQLSSSISNDYSVIPGSEPRKKIKK